MSTLNNNSGDKETEETIDNSQYCGVPFSSILSLQIHMCRCRQKCACYQSEDKVSCGGGDDGPDFDEEASGVQD